MISERFDFIQIERKDAIDEDERIPQLNGIKAEEGEDDYFIRNCREIFKFSNYVYVHISHFNCFLKSSILFSQ